MCKPVATVSSDFFLSESKISIAILKVGKLPTQGARAPMKQLELGIYSASHQVSSEASQLVGVGSIASHL
jgi:hypothetical protein